MADQGTQTGLSLPEIHSPMRFRRPQEGEKTPRVGGAPGQKILGTREPFRKKKIFEPATITSYRVPTNSLMGTFIAHGGQEVIPSDEHVPITGAVPVPIIRKGDEVVVRMMNTHTNTEMWPTATVVDAPENYPYSRDDAFKVKLFRQSIVKDVKRNDMWLRKKYKTNSQYTQTDDATGESLLLLQLRKLLPPAKLGEEVLFKCPDDGWYYFGKVSLDCEDFSYFITDCNGHNETIWREDIVCENDKDAENLRDHDRVLVMHPDYIDSYCPATMSSTPNVVILFDGKRVTLKPGDYVARIPKRKSERDEGLIKELAWRWTEKKYNSVIARHPESGEYHFGKVLKISNKSYTEYLVEWIKEKENDRPRQNEVKAIHIFGVLSPRRPLKGKGHVLAPSPKSSNKICYLPGEIVSVMNRTSIEISLVNKSKVSQEMIRCFWISPNYYKDAVITYINNSP